MTRPLVLKLGGELIETVADRTRLAEFAASASRPLVLVHGGGRAIDAELDRHGIVPRKVDGLRITDEPTLEVVVSVLGGSANTSLVAALVGQGVAAVGLTGVDACLGRANRVPPHRSTSGSTVDLGLVGDPASVDAALLTLLISNGYVPVIASLGIEFGALGAPNVLNVNADVMACRIAAALRGSDLVIAGTTAGVFDGQGRTIATIDTDGVEQLIAAGTATAGMVAKLSACRAALMDGVASIRILDGRRLDRAHGVTDAPGTTLISAVASAAPHTTQAGS